MKKIISSIFITLLLLASSAISDHKIALAGGDPVPFTNPIVRLVDPINPEQGTMFWTGKYCAEVELGDDRGTIPEVEKVLKCQQFDFLYSSGEIAEAGKDKSGCPKTLNKDGAYELVGTHCQLVQIKEFQSGVGLLKSFIEDIYKWGAGLGSIAAVLVIIVSGIQYITAGGDSGKVGPAKERIFQALAALAVLFLSGLILNAINPGFFTSIILFS